MNRNSFRELFKYAYLYRLELIIVFAALFSVAAALLSIGYLFKQLVDDGLGANAIGSLNNTVYQLILLIILFATASFFRSFYINNISEKICANIKENTYAGLLKADLVTFEELKIGDILSRLDGDVAAIGNLVTNFLSFLVRNLVMLIGGITLMFIQSPKLASLVVISVPLLLLPLLWLSKIVRRLSREVLAKNAGLAAEIEESFSGIRTIHAYNQQYNFTNSFSKKIREYILLSTKRLRLRSLFFALAISCVASAIIFVVWIGSVDIIEGRLTSGQMVSFIYYSMIVGMSAGGVAETISELQGPLAALDRVFELNSYGKAEATVQGEEVGKNDPLERFDLSFEGVSFAYPARPDIKVLKSLSAEFNFGKFYGVAGPSGSGKSTLFQILLKFYHHQEGQIKIGSHNIEQLNIEDIRKQVAYVAQDPSIFSGTIKSNIAFSNPEATDEQIMKVAKMCGILDFAQQLADGIDTEIGERGVRISGGQKQRIAIARSILYNPQILLLDEATSALDSDSEKQIMDNIRQLFKDKTIISIAHRISSIEDADVIYVIEAGKVITSGSHKELVQNSDQYRTLTRNQL